VPAWHGIERPYRVISRAEFAEFAAEVFACKGFAREPLRVCINTLPQQSHGARKAARRAAKRPPTGKGPR
jgi:hypothetical protein